MNATRRRRVAVVGSGVSGLTAAYVLRRHADVTLFEADSRLGGHAHTHDVQDGGRAWSVDSGFIVHNQKTYPLLCRLFDELGVQTRASEMSMSVRCDGCGLEYCGARGIRGLFPRPGHLANPRYLGMLAQIPVFHARARALLAQPEDGDDVTLGEFLGRNRYSRYFREHFVAPLVSAVWSCGPRQVMEYPARYLFAFLANHGMLSVSGSPQWRTVEGGSRSYVEKIAKQLDTVRTDCPVRTLTRCDDGVEIRDADDQTTFFDAAVVAGHADDALRMLERPTDDQCDILGAFAYSRNETVLHTDTAPLPRHAGAWGSWNYRLTACDSASGTARVSYSMNRLQGLDSDTQFVVTLGGGVDADSVLASMTYAHPIYTPQALAAQRRLPELNDSTLAFAGAYHGWGFHEDGCRAGVAAAESLGATW